MSGTTLVSPRTAEETRSRVLLKIGGVSALAVALLQVAGNALHPPMPPDTGEALAVIAQTGLWNVVHLGITVSYFLFIPFVLGAAAAFRDRPALVRIATPLVIVGAAIGAAQILTHLTIFKYLATQHAHGGAATGETSSIFLYELLWPYSVALEVAHLALIFVAALLFGVAMLRNPLFPRWIAWVGIAAGAVALAGIFIGKFVVTTRAGDLIFGFSLLPLIAWIVAVGIVLLRARPEPA